MESCLRYEDHISSLIDINDSDLWQVRHEIFFLKNSKNHFIPGVFRSIFAASRDFYYIFFLFRRQKPTPEVAVIVTLPGQNGMGTLRPALAALERAGQPYRIYPHPRLPASLTRGLNTGQLPRPPLRAVGEALRTGWRQLCRTGVMRVSDRWILATTAARGVLWRAAWARLTGGARGTLVMHNDFDMMSAASLGLGWCTVCLQHGIPSEEFFPARADHHVVWGESSATAYRAAGVPTDRLVIDSLGRAAGIQGEEAAPPPPGGIALISQSHAVIFGPGTRQAFREAALRLREHHAGLRILLHPNEVADHPYGDFPVQTVEKPPHALLSGRAGPDRHLVVGHASTALIDAALAGHYVLRLVMPLAGTGPNMVISQPPVTAADPGEVLAWFQRLGTDAQDRREYLEQTREWLARTFARESGAFIALIGKSVS